MDGRITYPSQKVGREEGGGRREKKGEGNWKEGRRESSLISVPDWGGEGGKQSHLSSRLGGRGGKAVSSQFQTGGERGERQTVIENSPPIYRYALQPKSTHIILKVRKKT